MALLFALQIKHLISDFYIQPSHWLVNKHRYFSIGGALHTLVHGVLSFMVLYGFTRNIKFTLTLFVIECVIHFHIDWIKACLGKANNWKTDQQVYWWAFGTDQALHHITYLLMIIAVDRYA
jgi:hypothetical protein